mmetsp:Transcript_978/g.3281  ORF Transcript_978/g.3281 Transcript_978/m.3281 type:complete len:217 (+) Transcript_978:49-699(+)
MTSTCSTARRRSQRSTKSTACTSGRCSTPAQRRRASLSEPFLRIASKSQSTMRPTRTKPRRPKPPARRRPHLSRAGAYALTTSPRFASCRWKSSPTTQRRSPLPSKTRSTNCRWSLAATSLSKWTGTAASIARTLPLMLLPAVRGSWSRHTRMASDLACSTEVPWTTPSSCAARFHRCSRSPTSRPASSQRASPALDFCLSPAALAPHRSSAFFVP